MNNAKTSVGELSPRETFVMEFNSDKPVGTDKVGNNKICHYLSKLADILGLDLLTQPRVHLSPKYGLSGWVPLTNQSAIHLYAWDDRRPSFISIDISIPKSIQLSIKKILSYTHTYFSARENERSYKSLYQGAKNWRELDDTIHRQRLSLHGKLTQPLTKKIVKEFLPELSEALDMQALSSVVTQGKTSWMHWETSGVLLDWEKNNLNLDIYTCKPFEPEVAAEFTTSELRLSKFFYRSF